MDNSTTVNETYEEPFFGSIVNGVKNTVKNTVGAVIDTGKNVLNGGGIGAITDGLGNVVDAVTGGVGDTVGDVAGGILSGVSKVVVEAVNGIIPAINEIVNTVFSTITGFLFYGVKKAFYPILPWIGGLLIAISLIIRIVVGINTPTSWRLEKTYRRGKDVDIDEYVKYMKFKSSKTKYLIPSIGLFIVGSGFIVWYLYLKLYKGYDDCIPLPGKTCPDTELKASVDKMKEKSKERTESVKQRWEQLKEKMKKKKTD